MNDSATIFQRNWQAYAHVLEHNYMHHAELQNQLMQAAALLTANTTINMLDIGCGDASQVVALLRQLNVGLYTGYDMSGTALQLAGDNITALAANVQLKEGDMSELVLQETELFDFIYSSFAIHHLHDDKKQELFNRCFALLKPGGILVYTDVFRNDHQHRQDYLQAYLGNMHSNWLLLDETDKQLIAAHVEVYDFPAEKTTVKQWLKQAGFIVTNHYEADTWHGMITAQKK